jgi:hypothetical protein
VTRLTANRYHDLCILAGEKLDHPKPAIEKVGSYCGWPTVVYMLGHRDPVTNALIVDYVGSAVRPKSDASERIREHLQEAEKRQQFTCQVVMPLRDDLPMEEVRRLEGVVARVLGVPRWCRRVPGGQRLKR